MSRELRRIAFTDLADNLRFTFDFCIDRHRLLKEFITDTSESSDLGLYSNEYQKNND
jgi:hypothetical protein